MNDMRVLVQVVFFFFFFQAEDGIRDLTVTGVQTCALPIYFITSTSVLSLTIRVSPSCSTTYYIALRMVGNPALLLTTNSKHPNKRLFEIGRASCRERV